MHWAASYNFPWRMLDNQTPSTSADAKKASANVCEEKEGAKENSKVNAQLDSP